MNKELIKKRIEYEKLDMQITLGDFFENKKKQIKEWFKNPQVKKLEKELKRERKRNEILAYDNRKMYAKVKEMERIVNERNKNIK